MTIHQLHWAHLSWHHSLHHKQFSMILQKKGRIWTHLLIINVKPLLIAKMNTNKECENFSYPQLELTPSLTVNISLVDVFFFLYIEENAFLSFTIINLCNTL